MRFTVSKVNDYFNELLVRTAFCAKAFTCINNQTKLVGLIPKPTIVKMIIKAYLFMHINIIFEIAT